MSGTGNIGNRSQNTRSEPTTSHRDEKAQFRTTTPEAFLNIHIYVLLCPLPYTHDMKNSLSPDRLHTTQPPSFK